MIQNLFLIVDVGLDPKPKLRKESDDRSKFQPSEPTPNISFQKNIIFLEILMGLGPRGIGDGMKNEPNSFWNLNFLSKIYFIFFVGGLGGYWYDYGIA